MRGVVAVFGRELLERRLLPAVALGLGLLPLGAVWLPELRTENPVEVRNGLALGLALIWLVMPETRQEAPSTVPDIVESPS